MLLAATWQDLHSILEAPVVALLKKWSVQPGGRQLIHQNWSAGRHTSSIFRADLAYGEIVPSNYGCKKVTVRVSIFFTFRSQRASLDRILSYLNIVSPSY